MRGAINKLRHLIEGEKSSFPEDVLQGLVDRLARTMRQLAVIAINDAQSVGGRAKQIANATEALNKGDSDAAERKAGNGIEHYRAAGRALGTQ